MKYAPLLYLLLGSILYSGTLWGQSPGSLSEPPTYPSLLEAYQSENPLLVNALSDLATPEITPPASKTGEEIQVLDSIVRFRDGLIPSLRTLYSDYTSEGFVQDVVQAAYDVATQSWIPQDSSHYDYQYYGGFWQTQQAIRLFWNATDGEWRDTLRYTLFNEQGQLLITQNSSFKGLYTYNSMGLVDCNTVFFAGPDGLQPFIKIFYTYAADSSILIQRDQFWKEGTAQFEDSVRISYTYDSAGNRTGQLREKLEGGMWQPTRRYMSTYTPSGQQALIIDQRWEPIDSTWRNLWRYEYTYNADDKLTENLRQVWIGGLDGEWQNQWRNLYTPDPTGFEVLEDLYQIWQPEVETWANSSRVRNTFSATDRLLSNDYALWDTSSQSWILTWANLYTYNSDDYIVEQIRQQRVDSLNMLVDFTRFTTTYDSAGITQSFLHEGITANLTLDTLSYAEYYYSPFTVLSLAQPEAASISVYPNPARSQLTIAGGKSGEVHVLDATGREVWVEQVSPLKPTISVEKLPKGFYHLVLKTDQGQALSASFYRE